MRLLLVLLMFLLFGCNVEEHNNKFNQMMAQNSRAKVEIMEPAAEAEVIVGKNYDDLKRQLRIMADMNYRVYSMFPGGTYNKNRGVTYAVIWRPRKGHRWGLGPHIN